MPSIPIPPSIPLKLLPSIEMREIYSPDLLATATTTRRDFLALMDRLSQHLQTGSPVPAPNLDSPPRLALSLSAQLGAAACHPLLILLTRNSTTAVHSSVPHVYKGIPPFTANPLVTDWQSYLHP
ncbi:unnamed protein product [Cyclocybe aegerita]|uniref:Uncharacterized protein n=1 Tax=Cyclocybe aegerita TaxID=1973307 RepID=A0A8S0WD16_CYCAE|nr:unnamed protein product [Cyclocybe aegerita]